MEVINDEYGDISPFEDGRKTQGKIMWYRPHDNLDPKYKFAEELDPNFVMPRPPKFKIEYFDDKRAIYFQRIKKSTFLPRCLREQLTTRIYHDHVILRCPSWDQKPVVDDFYNLLGLEVGKPYIFEFSNIW